MAKASGPHCQELLTAENAENAEALSIFLCALRGLCGERLFVRSLAVVR
jgi:hypothetical protein